ncbi:MAG: ATP-binding protein [Prolixibacteraceae bacterium]
MSLKQIDIKWLKNCFLLCLLICISSCRQSPSGLKISSLVNKQDSDSIMRWDSLAVALMNTDTKQAYNYATRAVSLASRINSEELIVKSLNVKGLVLLVTLQDSASFFLTRALSISEATSFKKERGSIYYNIAQQYIDATDFKNAIILLDSSIQSGFRYGQSAAVSSSLNALATIYQATEDSSMAKTIYDSAFIIAKKHNLPREMGIALGNLAQFNKNTTESIGMLKKAVQLMESIKGTEVERADLLVNLGLRQEIPDSAMFYYNKVIEMGRNCRIPIAMIGAYNNMAYFYLEKHDLKKATECIVEKAIPIATKNNSYDWFPILYDTYADILIEKKAYIDAVVWLRKSTLARAFSDNMIAKKQVRLLNAMLDLKNKNLIIVEKEQQITFRNARINRLKFWLALAGVLILLFAFGYFLLRQRARNKFQHLKLESAQLILEAEEHEKEKNGMELHDALGTLCLKVNDTIEKQQSVDIELKYALSLHIANFSDEVRSISHRMSRKILERHDIGPLLTNLCQETVRYSGLKLKFDISTTVPPVPLNVTMHVYRIVQELLNNARKYALDANINLSVRFFEKSIEIEYNDDGVGFSYKEKETQGMGLSNIFARVNMFNGTVVLDTVPGHGVYWKIIAPF